MRIALIAALAASSLAYAADIEDYTQVTASMNHERSDGWDSSGLGVTAHGAKSLGNGLGLLGGARADWEHPCSSLFDDCHQARSYEYEGELGLVWRRAGLGQLSAGFGRQRIEARSSGGSSHRHSVNFYQLGAEYYLNGMGVLGAQVQRSRSDEPLRIGQQSWTTSSLFAEYWRDNLTVGGRLTRYRPNHGTDSELALKWYGDERLALGATGENLDKDQRRIGFGVRYRLPFANNALTVGSELQFARQDYRALQLNLRYDFGPGAKLSLKERDRSLRY
ncbi:hypothetical protein [Chitinimonas lacunae]|uniref:Uncharacterized protein n=1 Tax=Chitinimonas lacunae TaxID=1963018 RepID=A0ABV8MTJ4_9NEIS